MKVILFFVDLKLLWARKLDNKLIVRLFYRKVHRFLDTVQSVNLRHLRKVSTGKHNGGANSEIGCCFNDVCVFDCIYIEIFLWNNIIYRFKHPHKTAFVKILKRSC